MGKTSFVSIIPWKAFIVASLVVFKERSKYWSQTFNFCVSSLWGWLGRGKSPNSWHSVNAFQASEHHSRHSRLGWGHNDQTMVSWCSPIMLQSLSMIKCDVMTWWENSFSILSICYTDHSHCSEVFTWTLSDEVVSSSCRYEWEAERSWSGSCVRCCELYWYWVVQ